MKCSFAVLGLFAACCSAAPQPQPWADRFVATLVRNGTAPDGSSTGPDIEIKFYDYSQPSTPQYKQECSINGVTSTLLLLGTSGYIFNTLNKACIAQQLPVAVVKPDWMMGGEYEGEHTINNVPSNKVGHYIALYTPSYCTTINALPVSCMLR
jgi:hypothetical protein